MNDSPKQSLSEITSCLLSIRPQKSNQAEQGPDIGKWRPEASRKVPPHHQAVVKTMKDHLLFLLFTKSAARGIAPAPLLGP